MIPACRRLFYCPLPSSREELTLLYLFILILSIFFTGSGRKLTPSEMIQMPVYHRSEPVKNERYSKSTRKFQKIKFQIDFKILIHFEQKILCKNHDFDFFLPALAEDSRPAR